MEVWNKSSLVKWLVLKIVDWVKAQWNSLAMAWTGHEKPCPLELSQNLKYPTPCLVGFGILHSSQINCSTLLERLLSRACTTVVAKSGSSFLFIADFPCWLLINMGTRGWIPSEIFPFTCCLAAGFGETLSPSLLVSLTYHVQSYTCDKLALLGAE